MSFRLSAAAFDFKCQSPSQKLVLVKLCHHAQEDGTRIFPSIQTIATMAECSTRQVQRFLKAFVGAGLLEVVTAGHGRGNATEYRLNVELFWKIDQSGRDFAGFLTGNPSAESEVEPVDNPVDNEAEKVTPCHLLEGKGDTDDSEKVTPATEKGDTSCHPNISKKDQSNRSDSRAADARPSGGLAADAAGQTEFEKRLSDGWAKFKADYPGLMEDWDNWDFIERTIWRFMSEDDRQEAIKSLPQYRNWLHANRKRTAAPLTYLKESRYLAHAAKASSGRGAEVMAVQPNEPIFGVLAKWYALNKSPAKIEPSSAWSFERRMIMIAKAAVEKGEGFGLVRIMCDDLAYLVILDRYRRRYGGRRHAPVLRQHESGISAERCIWWPKDDAESARDEMAKWLSGDISPEFIEDWELQRFKLKDQQND